MPTDVVAILNANWERVTVEARMGNNADPAQNASLGSRTLSRNQDWRIMSDGEDVFYRRDRDPDHPDGQMTDFVHRPCYGNGQTYEERV